MRYFLVFIGLVLCVFFSLVLQELIPPLTIFGSARVDLVPVFFCYGALLLPFPLAILLAMVAGLLVDLANVQILAGHVEIGLGWSIFFYVLYAIILQGVRPVFLRGRWEIHAFASGVCAILLVAAQFVMITFRRESSGFEWSSLVIWKILVPGSIAFLLAPVVYFLAKSMGAMHIRRRVREY